MKRKEGRSRLTLRIISSAVCILLTLGMLPIHGYAEAAAVSTVLDEIMSINTEPDAFDLDISPYGTKRNEAFMLAPQNELLLLRSWNGAQSGTYTWHGNFRHGSDIYTDTNTSKGQMSLIDSTAANGGPFNNKGTYSDRRALRFMQAVAFDPTGSGRDDHVAFIGFDHETYNPYGDHGYGNIQVYVLNANTGKVSELTHAGYATQLYGKALEEADAANFFGITAGHYDKNRVGETLVTYSPLHEGNYCIKEWTVTYEQGSDIPVLNVIKSDKQYLHQTYTNPDYEGRGMANSGSMGEMLACSLASGDIDGDRIDDLAVLSYVIDPEKKSGRDYTKLRATFYSPELVVVRGSTGSILAKNGAVRHWVRASDGTEEKGGTECTVYRTVAGPSVAMGDLNGDGKDEIVTAGWAVNLFVPKNNTNTIKERKLIEGVNAYIYGSDGDRVPRLFWGEFTEFDTNKVVNLWSKAAITWRDGAYNDDDRSTTVPQFKVECVALNGGGSAEYIFMNGTLNLFNDGKIEHKYTPEYFKNVDDPCHGMAVAFGFISSMAVGCFDGNEAGREQIAVSVGLRDGGSGDDNKDDYSYMIGMIGAREYDDTYKSGKIESYGPLGKYYATAFDRDGADFTESSDYMPYNTGATDSSRVNCLVVAVDRGYDGAVAKYLGKKFVYADPKVVGVLQAAPYFKELGYYGGETSYTVTVENEYGETSGESLSYSVGMSLEAEGPGVRVAVGAGYSGGFSESFEKSFGESYSTSFTATSHNQIIMHRTPIIIYQYALALDSEHGGGAGKWKDQPDENGNYAMEITVPCEPVYSLLTVPEYNEFAEAYNKKYGEAFNTIINPKLTDNEGHPEIYADGWYSGMTKLSKSNYEVTSASGYITSEYAQSEGSSKSSESSDGYYVNASLGAGASFPLGSVYAGIETSVEGSFSRGSFSSKSEHKAASGSVYNVGNLSGEVPSNILDQYGFTWSFGAWTMWLNKTSSSPVYGYVIEAETLRTAPNPPSGLTAEDGENEGDVDISWNAVNGALGYNIYTIDELGNYKKLNITPIQENKYTYTVPASYRAPSVIFAVTVVSDSAGNHESAFSQRHIYYRLNFALSAYELAVKAGFEGTEQQWLESLKGKDGNGIKDVDIEDGTGRLLITLDDGQVLDLGNIMGAAGRDGENGSAGLNGSDGRGIVSLEIDPAGELVVNYTDGTADNLGSLEIWAGKDGLTPYIGQNGNWWIGNTDTEVKAAGADGEDGKDGVDGKDGEDGKDGVDGQNGKDGIDGKDGEDGTDGVDGKDGTDGKDGKDGVGIAKIEKTATEGLVDTYTITFTDGTTATFTVTNGKDGIDGKNGEDGKNGVDGKNGKDGEGSISDVFVYIVMGAAALLGNVGWAVAILSRNKHR